jgi:hypothetical protein
MMKAGLERARLEPCRKTGNIDRALQAAEKLR